MTTKTFAERMNQVEVVLKDLEDRLDTLERVVHTYHPRAPVSCPKCGRAHTSISKFCTYCSAPMPTRKGDG